MGAGTGGHLPPVAGPLVLERGPGRSFRGSMNFAIMYRIVCVLVCIHFLLEMFMFFNRFSKISVITVYIGTYACLCVLKEVLS